ncbi:MAG: malto-oligosyltrehalose trehalohydrolase [bacterium]|nr:malto-oligosyltrehalose trehalohydrolase [bacterium]
MTAIVAPPARGDASPPAAFAAHGRSGRGVRRRPVGVEPGDGGALVRVWAPRATRVALASPSLAAPAPLVAEAGGYFAARVDGLYAGDRYAFLLDGGDPLPDPASRAQPDGPHGWSQVVDPTAFVWHDAEWPGLGTHGLVLYELHVGTFTPEGTFAAAAARLAGLRDVGVTAVEVMPIAEFPGRFGWGYDGVALWAPSRLYGTPDDVRRFVDAAHAHGLGVLLDVVYNHLGPDGCHLERFASAYFTDRYENEWGKALDFDGPEAGPVREFFVANAAYWIDEFHLDGLRLDATQQIFDASARHVLADIATAARAAAAPRTIVLVAENEPQEARLVRPPARGGYGLDALWNDDFHHAAVVAATGRREAYYTDYGGTPQELYSALRWGFLYQGQRYLWQRARRGTPALDLDATAFVTFLENHDQVANGPGGRRLAARVAPARLRALTALLLLGPATPMLFQGQEYWASAPFHYFADHRPDLARAVAEGRRAFLRQFPSLATDAMQAALPDPHDPETFARCRLDDAERTRHAHVTRLHRDLLRLRRAEPAIAQQRADRMHGAVLAPAALALRFVHERGDRLLLLNLGADVLLAPAPEPLLASPTRHGWCVLWSSEGPAYGGAGIPAVEGDDGWHLPGQAAVLLRPADEET